MIRFWRDIRATYGHPAILRITLLGFASGLPLLLVFSTLSFWLKDAGVGNAAIGLFSLVRTPYSFKFLWAPLLDHWRPPLVHRWLDRRRGWALLWQIGMMLAILAMATTDPASDPGWTAFWALIIAFCSASMDIVIDAYRVEALTIDLQGAGAGSYVLGYRLGMLASGAGALWLASLLPWQQVYQLVALLTLVGVATILTAPDSPASRSPEAIAAISSRHGRGRLRDAIIEPFRDFATRPYWLLLLAIVTFYKLGDAYLGVMVNPFYVETGFSKTEIAEITKVFAVIATIFGGLVGGVVVKRMGILNALLFCGVLHILANLIFIIQAQVGHHLGMLIFTVAGENISGGMGTTAFVAFLASLCSPAHTATQYALLTAITAFSRDLISASAGHVAEQLGWVPFFALTGILAIPGLLLLLWLRHQDQDALAWQAVRVADHEELA